MRTQLNHPYTLDELADTVALTRRTFTRKFYKATGMAIGEWFTLEHLYLAQSLLELTEYRLKPYPTKRDFLLSAVLERNSKRIPSDADTVA